MKARFEVTPVAFEIIDELSGAWSAMDYRQILKLLEVEDLEDIAESDLREMCFMALADLEPESAAEVLLVYRLGEKLNRGQIEDLAHEMPDERLWESYADMRFHEELFNVGQLLYDAFGGRFPRPHAVRLELTVKALDAEGEELLDSPSEAFLVRLLAGGMTAEATLNRLFEDQLSGTSLPEAESILWKCDAKKDGRSATLVLIGSEYWLEGMKRVPSYETTAHPDERPAPS